MLYIPQNEEQTFLKRNKSKKVLPPKIIKNIAVSIKQVKQDLRHL